MNQSCDQDNGQKGLMRADVWMDLQGRDIREFTVGNYCLLQ